MSSPAPVPAFDAACASARLPALATRTGYIEPFHVMELAKRAAALERGGRSIVHMSIGEPDFTAPPAVVHALQRAAASGATQYTAALGIEPLREAIARYHCEAFGARIDASRVIVTAGASAALSLACCALVDPGDRVLMADPGYPCNRHFVAAHDGVPVAVPTGADTRFQLDARLVDRHWDATVTTADARWPQGRVRGVLLASPSNPTGTSIAHDELGRIVRTVRARGGWTIVDEIYLGLTYDATPRSVLAFGDDVVVTGSFSKYFHMTGWRLGWLVVPPGWVGVFEKLAQNLFICASTLAQRAALACFEPDTMTIFEARRDEFRRRRDFIVPALRELGFGVPVTPDGAFYVYADCSWFSDDAHRFAIELLEQAGVSAVPGLDFGSHEPRRWMRFSYATSMERLHEAVARMRRHLGAHEREAVERR